MDQQRILEGSRTKQNHIKEHLDIHVVKSGFGVCVSYLLLVNKSVKKDARQKGSHYGLPAFEEQVNFILYM